MYESHSIALGATLSFRRRGFEFDSEPSFYCGLTGDESLNPVKQVLDILGESLQAVRYNPLGHYHFPDSEIAKITKSSTNNGIIAIA